MKSLLIVACLLITTPISAQSLDNIPEFARLALDAKFPGWALQNNYGNNRVEGDFNGDDRADLALHIQYGERQESDWYTPKEIVVIFNGKAESELIAMGKADPLHSLYLYSAGTLVCEVHTEDDCFELDFDALGVGYEEKGGWVWYWTTNGFRMLITGD